jgi:hypothetical protein
MMAYDSRSAPEPRPFTEETHAQLRTAVRALWTADSAPARDEAGRLLAAALSRAVAEARERELRAEEVLVSFKALLDDLPGADHPTRRFAAVRFREQLVTRCIQAYYAGS